MHPFVGGAQLRSSNVLPSHPFIQDPTMPPNPAPSPLIQLEEVRRRLEEEKIKSGAMQPKQRSEVALDRNSLSAQTAANHLIRVSESLLLFCEILPWTLSCRVSTRPLRYVMEVIQRGRSAVRPPTFPPLSVVPAVSDSELSEPEYVQPFLLHLAGTGNSLLADGRDDLEVAAAQKA